MHFLYIRILYTIFESKKYSFMCVRVLKEKGKNKKK